MQQLSLKKYPDEILLKPTKGVLESDLEQIKSYLPEMIKIMQDLKGVGLAANQVGLDLAFAIIDLTKDLYYDKVEESPLLIINPKILEEKNPVRIREGCLSLPGFYETVTRPSEVAIEYMDKDWNLKQKSMSGLMAQCLIHEVNHLNGKLLIDEMSLMVKQMYLKKARKHGLL